jgi:hypothetical protein
MALGRLQVYPLYSTTVFKHFIYENLYFIPPSFLSAIHSLLYFYPSLPPSPFSSLVCCPPSPPFLSSASVPYVASFPSLLPFAHKSTELEFLKSLWGLGTEEEEGYRTGPPGYIGWRNLFLGIDSGAPYTFKNTGSVYRVPTFLSSHPQESVWSKRGDTLAKGEGVGGPNSDDGTDTLVL